MLLALKKYQVMQGKDGKVDIKNKFTSCSFRGQGLCQVLKQHNHRRYNDIILDIIMTVSIKQDARNKYALITLSPLFKLIFHLLILTKTQPTTLKSTISSITDTTIQIVFDYFFQPKRRKINVELIMQYCNNITSWTAVYSSMWGFPK